MTVEICVDSIESAFIAEKSGTNRIELCSGLALGGLTPSWGLIEKAVKELSINIHVLVRARGGNFTYSKNEIDIMIADIEMARSLGVQGIVSGVLKKDQTIDIENTEKLMQACADLPFTFLVLCLAIVLKQHLEREKAAHLALRIRMQQGAALSAGPPEQMHSTSIKLHTKRERVEVGLDRAQRLCSPFSC